MARYEENITSTDSNNRALGQGGPSKGEFPGPAARKPLPPPLSCTSPSEFAAWEQDVHEYASGLENTQSPGASALGSSSTLAVCKDLCERWGYQWLEPQKQKSVVSQIWGLLPPTKGQVKVVSGRVLEKFVADSLERSLAERAYLGKEMFYLNHAWPKGSIQTDGENELLEVVAPDVINRLRVCPILWIFELGAGDLIKIEPILDKLELEGIKCHYCRVDINRKSLDETVRQLDEKYTHVKCSGLHGTFEDGLAMAAAQAGKKVIISLGSTLINFDNSQALKNLGGSCRDGNMVIIGHQGPEAMTGHDGEKLHNESYHTKEFERFILQGLFVTGNEVLGREAFKAEEWKIRCEITQTGPWSHDFIFCHKGQERFRAFSSKKFSEQEVSSMFKAVGAPSPAIHRHSKTAMRIYVVDCLGE